MPNRNNNGHFGALSNQSTHTSLPSCHSILKIDLTCGSKGKCNVKACGVKCEASVGMWGRMWGVMSKCLVCERVYMCACVRMYIHTGNVNEWD